MYKDFYGLKEEPFNITPDPRFLYWSQKHQEAFRHLVYGVQSSKGLAVLTGEPGTGKTAILHAVTEHLSELISRRSYCVFGEFQDQCPGPFLSYF